MDKQTSTTVSSSVSLSGLTFLVFLVLKLCNIIDWSWWWITAPLWGPIAFAFGILIVTVVIIFIKEWIKHLCYKRHEKKQIDKWR